jgi:hypothetical protein
MKPVLILQIQQKRAARFVWALNGCADFVTRIRLFAIRNHGNAASMKIAHQSESDSAIRKAAPSC